MDPADLDRRLDRDLRELPRPRAPHTLLPRVMAAAARQAATPAAAPTGWSTWPRAWQAAASAAVLAFGSGLAWLLMAPPAPVAAFAQTAGETAALMRVLWDVLLQPASPYLLVLGVAFALACAAAWAALDVALGGASQS
jgi:hypothetical protein